MRFFRSAKAARLFVLGLDGSPLPLLRRLMQSGDMPNLARIFETGSAVQMNSSLPDVSAVAWTSIITGMNPAKHGIYGFVDRRPGTKSIEVMTASHVKAKTLWQLASDAGKRAVSINVPLSFPPQRINGIVVSDFLAPSLDRAVYPTDLLPVLQSLGYRIDTDPAVARESLEAFLDDFRLTAAKRADAVLHFMNQETWDLFMVVFMETDRLHHFLWQYMAEDDATYGPKFVDAYRQIDGLVGRIVGQLSDEDRLIILSDHGFTTLKKEVYLNVWLEQEGFLAFDQPSRKSLDSVSAKSRAFSLDPGRVYVNLEGREAGGTVPERELGSVIEELAERLSRLSDPESGDPMIQHVYRADDIYHGPHRDRAPDLLVMPHDGYDIKGTFESNELTGKGKLVGMHKYDNATLFVRDRRITLEHASVHNVLPTACTLMGIEVPAGVDGQAVVGT